VPILYEVDRSRDGKSFTTRRVTAVQHGEQIFNLAASFQVPEQGYTHQSPMPQTKQPSELLSEDELRAMAKDHVPKELQKQFARPRPIELKPVDPRQMISPAKTEPKKQIWLRARGKVDPANIALQQCLLAYASDMGILASLDHSMWFHRPVRADEWHLYDVSCVSYQQARGLTIGNVFSLDGRHVATFAQEGLVRRGR